MPPAISLYKIYIDCTQFEYDSNTLCTRMIHLCGKQYVYKLISFHSSCLFFSTSTFERITTLLFQLIEHKKTENKYQIMTTRRKRSASGMENTISSQESVTKDLEKMVVHSQISGSSLESDTFKKPRIMSRRKPFPTGTITSEKPEYIDESFLPDYFTLELKFDEVSCMQPFRPLHGNYIVDLDAMVGSLSDVASCKKCKVGLMKIF